MATFCPYCDEEIEAQIRNNWAGDYWTTKEDFECPKCGKEMRIEVEMVPDFTTIKTDS
jgi:predicted RNA-binding Zn-ribbon protein involved in translation (DUF1610 family)